MEKKQRTVALLKEKRAIPQQALDARKKFAGIRKILLDALKGEEPKSIPQLAEATGLESSMVTYYLMTLLKFGEVEVDSIDDSDEYYLYKLKKA